jgi:Ca2+-binding RTX toxin-like protein
LLTLFALGWPPVTLASHVSITASATARLAERAGTDSWLVEVSWAATCLGVGANGASYQGNLYLIDVDTGVRTYLGGASNPAGKTTQLFPALDHDQYVRPELQVSCFEDGSLHGSGLIVASGAVVTIPARFGDGGGGGGSGGGGGGAGSGSGDPTEPLQSGGCVKVVEGTTSADTLAGSSDGDVIFGLGGNDVIRGDDGHDCLLGDAGNDRLYGEGGYDRLTGGLGKDQLFGGPGVNSYDAGRGNDYVDARNGRREQVRCGPGRDRARVDRRDRVRSCEKVSRAR